MEKLLPSFTLNEQLWTLYCEFTSDFCSDNDEKMRILRCSLKNCYTSVPLWLGYLIELERTESGLETLQKVIDQAKQQVGDKEKCFELDKFLHGVLSRQIEKIQDDEEARPKAIEAIREFYESKFIDLTQGQEQVKLTQWIMMQAQVETTRIGDVAAL